MKIWNEDYRPKTFDDMLMPPNQREAFKKYLADCAIPNVIFYGAPGTGKTSSALIFIRELGAEHLRLNGSDERSIETVREQIKNFIQTKSFNTKRKIVFYDEAEALTPDAFKALKEITERYQKTASFIFATNFLYKFPEAIRSRCTLFEFKKPSKEDALIFLKGILVKEKVEFRPEDLDTIYRSCAGDLRRSLNYLQRWSISGNLELPQDTYAELYKLIKAGNIIDLKRYFAMNSCDWDGLYRFLFEHIEDPAKAILLAKYAYQDGFVVDKEINFIGFCAELSRLK